MATTYHVVITKDTPAGQERIADFHGTANQCKEKIKKVEGFAPSKKSKK